MAEAARTQKKRKRTPAKSVEQRRLRFAHYYAGDPTSVSFRNGAEALRAVFREEGTELLPASAKRMAVRYMANPTVINEIDRIQLEGRVFTGVSGSEYIQRCLDREEFLTRRGARGDATAAARYMELAGKALGVLITKVEDVTPPERRLASTPDGISRLIEAAERLKRLSEPNPLPQITAKVVEVDYELTDDPENEELTNTADAVPSS